MSLPPEPLPHAAAPPPVPAQQLSYAAPAVEPVVLTPRAFEMLRQTRPWVAFFGIVLLVIGVLAAVGGVVGGTIALTQDAPAAAVGFLFYLVVAMFYLFPGFYLWRYARQIRGLMTLRASEHLEAALAAQKDFWRLVGILTALVLGLYALIIVVAVGGIGLSKLFP